MSFPAEEHPGPERSDGAAAPVMRQRWGDLLFLHWRVDPEALRPKIPEGLEIETFDGSAWVGITPFRMWGIAPTGVPAPPLISRTCEINVRTYVRRDDIPGIWFLSLDVGNPLVAVGARLGYALPYYPARMRLTKRDGAVHFSSRRLPGFPPADFSAVWRPGDALPQARPGTMEHFLVERYLLYASRGGRLYRARIHHPPWALRGARLEALSSTLLASHGLPEPSAPPLLHAQAAALKVRVWLPERV